MKLIIQPEDGPEPLLSALKSAKKSVEIAIFRFDRSDIEQSLKAAAANGVKVTALVAGMNHDGEKNLRDLEARFLRTGMTVARTSGDLVRYHDKYLIIDRKVLFVLSFNFTHLDIEHSRGFGIVTRNAALVQEAVQLFEADCARRAYAAGPDSFVVSPANSRKVLRNFLKRAKKQLLIYDPQISDREMIRILHERVKAGVDVRIIGKTSGRTALNAKKLTRMRLHTRTIIRDGRQAFIGSQSLRPAELDSRRELGLIVRDGKVVKKLLATFESDWKSTDTERQERQKRQDVKVEAPREGSKKDTEKALAELVEELHPVATTVQKAVRKVAAEAGAEALPDKAVKATVKKVVKRAVKKAVREVARDAKKARG